MSSVKVSISLPSDDLAYVDTQTLSGRYASRSAALHDAIRMLRESELADAYAEAFGEWQDDGWESTAADGLGA
ncbi:ribbon-helix-helix domain-containing protein [Protaetiibacter mangrovi]|uniref:Ribbon-helix-helix domain-containing protein n=1 Tax=Protaetiibacter mangrovi TaxID=2970926 RepID=A0ABT1ZEP4_9MICO|nr:ribbon-helix-helix domain-containing protein [Protaetiibacter mangrovi]MCS0499183.1 ribbon-helix-helix domain-containing protein [Protaetiibacter mangrovi]